MGHAAPGALPGALVDQTRTRLAATGRAPHDELPSTASYAQELARVSDSASR